MKHLLYLLALLALPAAAQVGIGAPTPVAGAMLEVRATNAGLLIPRLTAGQRTGISVPPQGLLVYQTDGTAGGGTQSGFWYYTGTGGWVYLNASLTLPYAGTASTSSAAFDVTNTGPGPALSGTGNGAAAAVQGLSTSSSGSAVGVLGTTTGGYGVRGLASASGGYGVEGRATDSRGISGFSASGVALFGSSTTGLAVQGLKGSGDLGRVAQFTSTDAANDSTGLYVSTAGARAALRAVNTSTSSQAAIRGVKQSASTDGIGVEGVVTSGASGNAAGVLGNDQSGSGGGSGVIGLTAGGYGVRGIATASGGYGVSGTATTSYGVIGGSASGVGVYGSSSTSYGVQGSTAAGATGSAAGVYGTSSGGGVGVLGTTTTSSAVRGVASGSSGFGVEGSASGNSGRALYGFASGAASGLVVQGSGTGQAGYFGQTNSSNAANALEVQNAGNGVSALFQSTYPIGSKPSVIIRNQSFGPNLQLIASSTSTGVSAGIDLRGNGSFPIMLVEASPYAVESRISSSDANGVMQNRILMGAAFNNANYLQGNWNVTGSLSKGGGSFKIDHPLDPENQYLYHSFVESPDMLNIYNGNVVLDAKGEATVALPDWFESLNRDFRYQLTPIGAAFTPYVLAEVKGNQFRIAGQPGGKVSWQVTGIRQDKWANQNRIPVEQAKEPENQGKYLHPAAYGLPVQRGIGYRPTRAGLAPAAAALPAHPATANR